MLVLLVGGGLFLRQFNAPVTPVAAAPTTMAVSAPTLPAAPTAPPRTLAAATLPPSTSTAATPLPTSRPTAVPTAVATAQPTTDQHSSAAPAGQTAEPSPFPTVAPELRREVETAYTQYWDARAQAVWTLDAAPLDNVSTGDELLALRHDVQQLRTDDRAIKVEVEHQFTVIRVDGDQAQVLDRLRDYSIYVDPTSKQPLPGRGPS